MRLVVELLVIALVAGLLLGGLWVLRGQLQARAAAPWRPRTRALPEGGQVVELVRPGEPPQEVRRVAGDLDWDELGTQLAEATSEAEARAATLNAARRR